MNSGTCCRTLIGTPRAGIDSPSRFGDRSTLKQIQRPVGDRPFDVSPRSVHLFAPFGKLAELAKAPIIEAQALDELRRHVFLDRPSGRYTPNGDLLEARLPLEHLSR